MKTLIFISYNSDVDKDKQIVICERFAKQHSLNIETIQGDTTVLKNIDFKLYDLILTTCFVSFGDDIRDIFDNFDYILYKNPNIKLFTVLDSSDVEFNLLSSKVYDYFQRNKPKYYVQPLSQNHLEFSTNIEILKSISHKKKNKYVKNIIYKEA